MFIQQIDENLSIRLIEMSDADRVFTLTDDHRDYLKEWLPWVYSTHSVEDTRNFIRRRIEGYKDKKMISTVILFNGEIVGMVGFTSIDISIKTAYIGYWLGEDFQGNGIMTKVTKALTDYGMDELKLNKVEIRAAVGNHKSRRVPENLGFIYEGTIRAGEWNHDHFVDVAVYGLLAGEWQQKT